MDQTGYPGVDENTFLLAMHGKTPPPAEGEAEPGITTGSLASTSTAGFGEAQREGGVSEKRRGKK